MSRNEVAVGTVSDSVMFCTNRAAVPVMGVAPGGAGSTERGAGGAAGAGAGVAAACSVLRAPWMIGSSASFPLSNSSRHSGATDEGSRRYSSYMTCTKAALWVPKTNSLTRWNLQGILCDRMALLALALILLQTQSPHTSLRAQVVARILQTTARGVGVYYRDLTTGDSLTVGSDGRFHAASTMKIPVMIQLFRDRDAGLLSLDDSITVTNTFHSIVDSSPYQLDVSDDSDSSLYKRAGGGQRASIRQLDELMETVSSNLATNLLIALVDAKRANATAHSLGADSILVLRGVEDGKAYRAGMNNTTTARDLGMLFTALAQYRAASPAA